METPHVEPMSWVLGIVGTITTGWIALTSRTVVKHEVEIAVLKEGQKGIKEALNRLETHFGTNPKEN